MTASGFSRAIFFAIPLSPDLCHFLKICGYKILNHYIYCVYHFLILEYSH